MSCSTSARGTLIEFALINASKTRAFVSRLSRSASSRSMFLRTSAVRSSTLPEATPKLVANASSSGGSTCSSTRRTLITNSAFFPASSLVG